MQVVSDETVLFVIPDRSAVGAGIPKGERSLVTGRVNDCIDIL
jgi:hypothetical protein